MGSFNLQCGITRQTINDDDRAFISLAVRNSGYGEVLINGKGPDGAEGVVKVNPVPSITTPQWETLSVFIEAKAEDYGRFEIADSLRNRLALGGLFAQLNKSMPATESDDGRDSFSPADLGLPAVVERIRALKESGEFLDMDSLEAAELFGDMRELFGSVLEAVSEGLCFSSTINRTYEPIQLVCIHGHAYDALKDMGETSLDSWKDPYEERLKANLARKINFTRDYHAQKDSSPIHVDHSADVMEVVRETDGTSVGRDSIALINPIRWMVEKVALSSDMEDVAALSDALINSIGPILDDGKVFSTLDHMNLRLGPVVYAGQDYQNELGKMFTDLTQKVSGQIDTDMRERYGEDMDEEEGNSSSPRMDM